MRELRQNRLICIRLGRDAHIRVGLNKIGARFVDALERKSRSVTIAGHGRRARSAVRYVLARGRPAGYCRA